MIGVQSQLSTLSQIIRTIDPKLHQHLGMKFCLLSLSLLNMYVLFLFAVIAWFN